MDQIAFKVGNAVANFLASIGLRSFMENFNVVVLGYIAIALIAFLVINILGQIFIKNSNRNIYYKK